MELDTTTLVIIGAAVATGGAAAAAGGTGTAAAGTEVATAEAAAAQQAATAEAAAAQQAASTASVPPAGGEQVVQSDLNAIRGGTTQGPPPQYSDLPDMAGAKPPPVEAAPEGVAEGSGADGAGAAGGEDVAAEAADKPVVEKTVTAKHPKTGETYEVKKLRAGQDEFLINKTEYVGSSPIGEPVPGEIPREAHFYKNTETGEVYATETRVTTAQEAFRDKAMEMLAPTVLSLIAQDLFA